MPVKNITYQILILIEGAILGSLDHILVCGDIDLNATVLGTTCLGVIAGNGIVIGQTLARKACFGNTGASQIVQHLGCTCIGHLLVSGTGTHIVGMTIDLHVGLGIVDQRGGKLVERSLSFAAQLRAVESEEDTVVEGHLDALEAVDVGASVHLSTSNLSELTSLLVHLLADTPPATAPIAPPIAAPLPLPMRAPIPAPIAAPPPPPMRPPLVALFMEPQPEIPSINIALNKTHKVFFIVFNIYN